MVEHEKEVLRLSQVSPLVSHGMGIRFVIVSAAEEELVPRSLLSEVSFHSAAIDCAHNAGVFERRRGVRIRNLNTDSAVEFLEEEEEEVQGGVTAVIHVMTGFAMLVEVRLGKSTLESGPEHGSHAGAGERKQVEGMTSCLEFVRCCCDHLDPYRRHQRFFYNWVLTNTHMAGVTDPRLSAAPAGVVCDIVMAYRTPLPMERMDFTLKRQEVIRTGLERMTAELRHRPGCRHSN